MVSHNDMLVRKPELLNVDVFGDGWMLVVRPARGDWREGLVTGAAIAMTFETWLAAEAYRDRSD